MEYGINVYCYGSEEECSLRAQCELMRENGFTKTFHRSYKSFCTQEIANLLLSYGITFDTLHAPFSTINDIWKNDESGDAALTTLTNGIDRCVIVGAPTLIVHLSSGVPAPRISDAGNRRFDALMEYAGKKNIKIAYENQRYVANLASVLEQYPEAGFCWDVGHEGCFTPGKRFMPLFGDRLCALHLHDNPCELNNDAHMLPYDGNIDYDYAALAIAESGFRGTLMLEVLRTNSHHYDGICPEDYYRLAGNAARRLNETVELIIEAQS